jgi:RNA-directed DNA polymerase
MMHEEEKSDSPIVPAKPGNKAASAAAESVEGSGGTKRNAGQQSTDRTQCREVVSQAQARIREAVSRNRKEKLTALLHHITVEALRSAFLKLKKRAAVGVDQVSWVDYAADLDRNLTDLHARVQRGAYRALPSRRVYIPKTDGKLRPLGIAAMEDKLVQAAVAMILTPIYEAEFLGFSYGFRPGRNQHQALDALAFGIKARKVCWVLDADISRFFDTISHAWTIKFVRHRIGDERIIRLIQKWLKAGVLEDGRRHETVEGTPQGAVISPLLANIYLHYVYDLWVEQWRRRAPSLKSGGDMIVVRSADDTIVGFQHQTDAERFLIELKARLAQFALSLHPEKTRLIAFGKFAADRRSRRGLGKPETFDFLGFTHICETKADGSGFQLWRKTIRKRLKAKVREIKEELRRHVHASIAEQGRWLGSVMRGYFAYHAVPTISAFRFHVVVAWVRTLRRRSQKHRLPWERMQVHLERSIPKARVLHPWPEARFRVRHAQGGYVPLWIIYLF